jgi:aminoglycoside phosphotransferase (APT) family kinase protein
MLRAFASRCGDSRSRLLLKGAQAQVLAGGPDAGVDAPFLVMDLAPGRLLLAGLDGSAALRQLPALSRRLPDLLGRVTAQLHALDPEPVRVSAHTSRLSSPTNIDAFMSAQVEAATETGRSDPAGAARWLVAHPPPRGRSTVCHGDVQPFNLLVHGDQWTLLDWTTALLAEPAYDVAFTILILRHPPVDAPKGLRPILSAAGALLARRFVAAYRRAGGDTGPASTLNWYTAVHSLRILVEVEGWQQEPNGGGKSTHPWTTIAPAAARLLAQTTNTHVEYAGVDA